MAYHKAPYFKQTAGILEPFYTSRPDFLANFTIAQTIALARSLGIRHTRFMRSSEIPGVEGSKTDRLLSILTNVGATHYISGPSASEYIENEKFEQAGISLEFMEYDYPEYPQLYPPFEPQVSIIDLMFMTGPQALGYILSPDEVTSS